MAEDLNPILVQLLTRLKQSKEVDDEPEVSVHSVSVCTARNPRGEGNVVFLSLALQWQLICS